VLVHLLQAIEQATPKMFIDDLQLHAQPTAVRTHDLPLDINFTVLAFRSANGAEAATPGSGAPSSAAPGSGSPLPAAPTPALDNPAQPVPPPAAAPPADESADTTGDAGAPQPAADAGPAAAAPPPNDQAQPRRRP
jgi:hypothetical protein